MCSRLTTMLSIKTKYNLVKDKENFTQWRGVKKYYLMRAKQEGLGNMDHQAGSLSRPKVGPVSTGQCLFLPEVEWRILFTFSYKPEPCNRSWANTPTET